MHHSSTPITERLAEIGGQLQKLRWEALDIGQNQLAQDITHAIDAIAWAAGIYHPDANIVERSGFPSSPAGQAPEIIPDTRRAAVNTRRV